MSAALVIPTFLPPAPRGTHLPDRLVAAVRYDFEYGLLSVAQCIERYSTLVGADMVRDICAGRAHPDVKASRMKLLWR